MKAFFTMQRSVKHGSSEKNPKYKINRQLVVNIGYVSVEMADFFFIARPNTLRL